MWKKRIGVSLFVAVLYLVLIQLFPSWEKREREYYSDPNNFITVTGVVTQIDYHDENERMYIQISDKSVSFTDTGFVIKGANFNTVQENEIQSVLSVGDEIEFMCAPRYFGDGYKIPIVAVFLDGKTLLDFDVGYRNLMDSYE